MLPTLVPSHPSSQLAKTHHPDKGGNLKAFEQIQKSYDILSDPQKKAKYDQFGITDDSAPSMPSHHSMFRNMFQRKPAKTDDIVYTLKLTLLDLFVGTSKKLKISTYIIS